MGKKPPIKGRNPHKDKTMMTTKSNYYYIKKQNGPKILNRGKISCMPILRSDRGMRAFLFCFSHTFEVFINVLANFVQ